MGDYFFGEEVMSRLTGMQHSGFGDGVPVNERGVPPCGRAYFLLLRQKKVAKEKATPGAAPAAPVPCATRNAGRLAKLACGSDNASRLPPAFLRCSAPSTGTRKASTLDRLAEKKLCYGQPEKMAKNEICNSGTQAKPRIVSPGPLRGAEQRRNAGGSRRGLSEGRSPEFRSRPAFRVAQGTGAAGTDPGVAFSLATFFWPHKRKYARPQGGNPSQLAPRRQPQGNAQEKPRHA